jgi:hypothetical protein
VLPDRELTSPGDVIDRLVPVLDGHPRFHAGHGEVFIGYSELRGLPPELRKQIMAKRREYEGLCFSYGTKSSNPFGR